MILQCVVSGYRIYHNLSVIFLLYQVMEDNGLEFYIIFSTIPATSGDDTRKIKKLLIDRGRGPSPTDIHKELTPVILPGINGF